MKTHRIILPRERHAAALAGVDRLLLPMREQPRTDEVPGVVWFHVGDRAYGGKRVFAEDGCPYKPGDRLALLERFVDIPGGAPYYEINVPGSYWRSEVEPGEIKWSPASRMPLRACRCFYRVLAVDLVREDDTWVWNLRVERWVNA